MKGKQINGITINSLEDLARALGKSAPQRNVEPAQTDLEVYRKEELEKEYGKQYYPTGIIGGNYGTTDLFDYFKSEEKTTETGVKITSRFNVQLDLEAIQEEFPEEDVSVVRTLDDLLYIFDKHKNDPVKEPTNTNIVKNDKTKDYLIKQANGEYTFNWEKFQNDFPEVHFFTTKGAINYLLTHDKTEK